MIKVILKIFGCLLIGLGLMSFASDFLPVDGLRFGQLKAEDGSIQYMKIVPAEGVNFVFVGFCLLIAGVGIVVLARLLSRLQPSKDT